MVLTGVPFSRDYEWCELSQALSGALKMKALFLWDLGFLW